jgi:VWFA-related protein
MSIGRTGMNHRISKLAAVALAPLLCAQEAEKPVVISTDVNVVNVFATVRDKKGAIVKDLNKDDFVLDEEGRPQTIKYFARESNLPLTLGLVIDTSGSQRRVLGQEREASSQFLEQVLREDKDQAYVIHFEAEVELLQDLTSSRKLLQQALQQLEAGAGIQVEAAGIPAAAVAGTPAAGSRGGAEGHLSMTRCCLVRTS